MDIRELSLSCNSPTSIKSPYLKKKKTVEMNKEDYPPKQYLKMSSHNNEKK